MPNLANLVHKVQLFWEGHKNLQNLSYGFDIYLVNVKIIGQIVQIFLAFSEKLNFTWVFYLSEMMKNCFLDV